MNTKTTHLSAQEMLAVVKDCCDRMDRIAVPDNREIHQHQCAALRSLGRLEGLLESEAALACPPGGQACAQSCSATPRSAKPAGEVIQFQVQVSAEALRAIQSLVPSRHAMETSTTGNVKHATA